MKNILFVLQKKIINLVFVLLKIVLAILLFGILVFSMMSNAYSIRRNRARHTADAYIERMFTKEMEYRGMTVLFEPHITEVYYSPKENERLIFKVEVGYKYDITGCVDDYNRRLFEYDLETEITNVARQYIDETKQDIYKVLVICASSNIEYYINHQYNGDLVTFLRENDDQELFWLAIDTTCTEPKEIMKLYHEIKNAGYIPTMVRIYNMEDTLIGIIKDEEIYWGDDNPYT